MEPEIPTLPQEGSKKKILVLVSVAVLILLAVAVYVLTRNNVTPQTAEVVAIPVEKKSFTQEEKQMILESLAKTTFNTPTTQAEKQRILSNLAKQSPASTISQEEKQKILAELTATAGQ